MTDSDLDIIQACLGGREDVYEKLVFKYQADISARMWRFCRNKTMCEELVQDVFVEAYLSLGSYRAEAPFINWLQRIATYIGYKYWRIREKDKKLLSLEDRDIVVYDKEHIDSEQSAELLHNILSKLKSKDRLVLTLLYFDNYSLEEIADITGWNKSAVKMRIHRAKKRLHKIVENNNLLEDLL